jgi:hypothetical protein
MKIASAFAACLAFLCVIFNLLASPAAADEPDKGYPLTTVLWPLAPIPTCWKMDVQAFNESAGQREIVRQAVATTWEASSLIQFTGWDKCIADVKNNGITIIVNTEGPATFGLGTRLKNRDPSSMQLNFTFTQWGEDCLQTIDECIRIIAVHEFGHALGFAHEQNRADTPQGACDHDQGPQGTNGDMYVGAWDLSSVMNYCNPHWNGDGNLSATDIAMVRRFYGDPTADTSINIFDESGNFLTVVQ